MIGNDCVNHSVSDRDCSHCIWHTSGQCANWNCEPVSRKEALEALEKVKAMESAQSTHSNTPNTLETLDCISRQALIDLIDESYTMTDNEGVRAGYSIVKLLIDKLPSVQPDVPDTDVGDTISRQQAIDKHMIAVIDGVEVVPVSYIKSLKSVQPEIIRCRDCKYRDENWRRISVRWLPCMDMRTGSNWYCGSAERRTDE